MAEQMSQPPSKTPEIMRWLNSLPSISLSRFRGILKLIDQHLNGCAREPAEIPVDMNAAFDPKYDASLWEHSLSAYEDELVSCVEYGRVDQLNGALDNIDSRSGGVPPKMAENFIRAYKNTCILATGIISRAALKGGLSYDTVNMLAQEYILNYEKLDDYHSLFVLMRQMFVKFATLVSKQRYSLDFSPLSLKISKIAINRLYEKVTPAMIADELQMHVVYLCRKFKEDTGKTITTYINEIKIDESKRLLKNTDDSLADIAAKLGYSAQNYFQSVFKKIEGVTPTQYRNSPDL
jgi:AraC-like DNA-binding protein